MKKIFFFSLFFFFPWVVSATDINTNSITDLKVLNGILSRKFEPTNNIYSIILNNDASVLELDYVLGNTNAEVIEEGFLYRENQENKASLTVISEDGTKEVYTFYLEKEEEEMVFLEEIEDVSDNKTKNPYLIYYVGIACFFIILVLFKVIVLGFK